jgi:vancomycin resistance protein YoaR
MFNGGVCGAATQLFRLSLIMPDLSALDRQAHSQRYTRYYDEYIFGDDAAVYEMKKKLTVKNDSKGDIYLRVLNKDPYHILI